MEGAPARLLLPLQVVVQAVVRAWARGRGGGLGPAGQGRGTTASRTIPGSTQSSLAQGHLIQGEVRECERGGLAQGRLIQGEGRECERGGLAQGHLTKGEGREYVRGGPAQAHQLKV